MQDTQGWGALGMYLESTRFISRGKGVALTTPLPSSPPASRMVRLPKQPARSPAAGGLWRAAGEGAPPRLPQAKDEHITLLFRNLGQDPCHPQGRAPAHQRNRHQGSCLLLWAHSHPPRQQAPSSSTPATSPGASLYDSPPQEPPSSDPHLSPVPQLKTAPLVLPASAHSFSSAEISFLDSFPKELLLILQDTKQECPFP